MRRPLFAVALFLVITAAVSLGTGWAEAVPYGSISTGELEAAQEFTITGQVYQKNETSIYLKSVVLIDSDFSGSEAFGQSAVDSRQEIPVQENIICETEGAQGIPLGCYVAVEGQFSPYTHATNPGEFDAAVYYRTLEVGGKLRKASVLARGEEYWKVREWLYGLKMYFKERLYRIFPKKEAAVMSALLLGDKNELDSDLKELYKRNGVLHILSISSLHITIIGMTVYRLLRRTGLPLCPCALAGSAILILYGCMTGFSVSACRAIGMYLIKMGAEMTGRTYDMLTALGVMAAFMVVQNPFYLQNSGFLLSFSSVLGIGVVYPLLMPEVTFGGQGGDAKPVREKCGVPEAPEGGLACVVWKFQTGILDRIRDAAAGLANAVHHPGQCLAGAGATLGNALLQSFFASLSITLTTLPVQLWFYYEIPVYSVFLNLFIIPLVKPMMITGLLAMLVPGLGGLGAVGRLILGGYELLCGGFDQLPFHTWNPGCPAIWQIVVYYLLLGGAVCIRIWRKHYAEKSGSAQMGAAGKMGMAAERLNAGGKAAVTAGKACVAGKAVRMKTIGTAGSIVLLTIAVLLFIIRPQVENSVTFLDVGQGDCILLRTASGEVYLFDCGSSSRKNIGKYILLPFLKYHGIQTIDAVFLSHPDADHVNGAVELFALGGENHIRVNQLLLPDIQESAREEHLGELVTAATEASQGEPVPVGYVSAGDGWVCDSAVFTCLHPASGFDAQDINACSECFLVEFYEEGSGIARTDSGGVYGKHDGGQSNGFSGSAEAAGGQEAAVSHVSQEASWTLLLTGDVQEKGEEAFLRELQERNIHGITVLKAAHHGSRNSTPEELLDQITPILTVISSGRNNRYGHPHAELLERLEDCGTHILQTAQFGAVTVTNAEGRLVAVPTVSE